MGDSKKPDRDALMAQKVDELKIRNVQRHIFLCADQTEPKCSPKKLSLESWEYLKRRLNELGLAQSGAVYRTRNNFV